MATFRIEKFKLMHKKFILSVADFISIFWKFIPFKLRRFIFTILFILESRDQKASKGLSRIFLIKDNLEWIINERALVYGGGIHPKHRLTSYHDFFVERIKNGETVLDVGCGIGVVSISLAQARRKSKILGIDIDKKNIDFANKLSKEKAIKNINFICGDINLQKNIKVDTLILSNILEHINNRPKFIKQLKRITHADNYLIRVPLFERDWQLPLRKELKIYYFSDMDHKIEHTIEQFKKEMLKSELEIKEIYTNWGEIWARCKNEV